MDRIPLDYQMSALVEEARVREYHGRCRTNELRVDANGEVETEPESLFMKILLNMLQMVECRGSGVFLESPGWLLEPGGGGDTSRLCDTVCSEEEDLWREDFWPVH